MHEVLDLSAWELIIGLANLVGCAALCVSVAHRCGRNLYRWWLARRQRRPYSKG